MPEIITNQIEKIQTSKKLIALYDKLNAVQTSNYAQLHAKGETVGNRKVYSLIGIEIQDYSAGTGENNMIVRYNLSPEEIQFLLTRVELGYVNYDFSETKIFGEPDQNGTCKAQIISIQRIPYDKDGQLMKNPWQVTIDEGRGVKASNSNGGFYMKGGTFKSNKSAFIKLADADFYKLLKRADSYIRNWEAVTAMQLIPEGRQAYAQYVQFLQQRAQQNQQQGNTYDYGNYGQPAYGGEQYYDGYGTQYQGGYDQDNGQGAYNAVYGTPYNPGYGTA